jgi:hypothetical protein
MMRTLVSTVATLAATQYFDVNVVNPAGISVSRFEVRRRRVRPASIAGPRPARAAG